MIMMYNMNSFILKFILLITFPVLCLQTSLPVQSLGKGPSSDHTCVLLSEKKGVKCFGRNANGELGLQHFRQIGDQGGLELGNCLKTAKIPDVPISVAVGSTFTCVLDINQRVYCYGDCDQRFCGYIDLPPVESIYVGEQHACALLANDQGVRCWGQGDDGRLGTGQKEVLKQPKSSSIDFGPARKAVKLSCGFTHTCAILNTTETVCFGDCVRGKCGNGQVDDVVKMGASLLPALLPGNLYAIEVSAGAAHTCVLLNSLDISCFGYGLLLGTGDSLDIGDDSFEVAKFVNLTRKAQSVSVGQTFSCAILDNGKSTCWGIGTIEEPRIPFHYVLPLQLDKITQLEVFHKHACALSESGEVICFGDGSQGQVGLLVKSNVKPCFGCSLKDLKGLEPLNFGCVRQQRSKRKRNKTKNDCPYLGDKKCSICRANLKESTCISISKCKFTGNRCEYA